MKPTLFLKFQKSLSNLLLESSSVPQRFDISDCENWVFDGYSVVDADKQDKESEAYKKGDIYNPYRGCKPLKLIERLEVVT